MSHNGSQRAAKGRNGPQWAAMSDDSQQAAKPAVSCRAGVCQAGASRWVCARARACVCGWCAYVRVRVRVCVRACVRMVRLWCACAHKDA